MLISEITRDECRRRLGEATLCRLACAEDAQPYVVPVYLAAHGDYLYGVSSLGKKIEWMRANPLVCVEIDDVKSADEWTTLIVFGSYEELPDTLDHKLTRSRAYDLLRKRAMWWQPAYVAVAGHDQSTTLTPVVYRIRIDRVTGRRALPEQIEPAPVIKRGLLKGILSRIRSKSENIVMAESKHGCLEPTPAPRLH
jgi:uncharacterized protein